MWYKSTKTPLAIKEKRNKTRQENIELTKTDKFLYGGFAAVALASLVTMLVFIFSPPKHVVEETADQPPP